MPEPSKTARKYIHARYFDVLENPTWDEVVDREPLLAFSFYLAGRINVLLSLADEIEENLDQGFSGSIVLADRIERSESLMWLWILGAYEVVRTMCQAKCCFSSKLQQELMLLK
jgi:hypothetical protein